MMDQYGGYVIAVYGATGLVLVGYLAYLYARLRKERDE